MLASGKFNPDIDKVFPEKKGYVFVFGSNLAGIHGGGAAKEAVRKYGAEHGNGEGSQGISVTRSATIIFRGAGNTCSYALPTKGFDIETLPLNVIQYFVGRFNQVVVNEQRDLTFFLTRVGCGLGGYTDKDILPLFKKYKWTSNIIWPNGWE